MKASVIIPTYSRPTFLLDALVSVQTQDFPTSEYEIIIVDNAPHTTLELEALSNPDAHPPMFYVHEQRNGLHNARHAGARAAKGEILVYIDDDVVAPENWLKAILEPYGDTQVACVGGGVKPKYEASPPNWIAQFSSYLSLLDYGDHIRELLWPEDIYGCNFSIRKNLLFDLGGFHPDAFSDPKLQWYRGDGETGLLQKVYRAGFKVIYTPDGWLYHRVPNHRLTVEYIAERAFRQGISDGFSFYRKHQLYGFITLELVRSFLRFSGINLLLQAKKEVSKRTPRVVRKTYWQARINYAIRLLMSKTLRDHVLREHFL